MKMQNTDTIKKAVIILAIVILLVMLLSNKIGSGETLKEYAEKHPKLQHSTEAVSDEAAER